MKRLLFISFTIVALSLTASAQVIDLQVKDVKIGTPYSEVIKKLGKPLLSKKGGSFPCDTDNSMLTLRYPGLIINLIEAGDGTGFIVASMKVTSPKWSVASGINVGASLKDVRATFGDSEIEKESGSQYLSYAMAEGFAKFYFRNNKLIKIAWEFNIC